MLDEDNKFLIEAGEIQFDGLKKEIRLNRLNFSYQKGIEVLKDTTTTIEQGRITAIVGPTGAGKTTIGNLIPRFYDCPPASIFIDGVDIRHFKLKSLREHIALVSQEIMLFNDTINK